MKADLRIGLVTLILLAAASYASGTSPGDGADNFTLGIFGNANMDNTIDGRDIEYLQGVINGSNAPTRLSDANYDGRIDQEDVIQVEQIMDGREKKITVVCNPPNGKNTTIEMPVKRVIVLTPDSAEAIVAIGSGDKLVGIPKDLASMNLTFPVVGKLPVVGSSSDPDCEAAISLNPDVIITYGKSPDPDKLENKLKNTNITVVRLDCWKPEYIAEDVEKLGYLLGKRTNADEIVDFQAKYLELIRDRLEAVPDDRRPRAYLEGYGDYSTWSTGWGIHWHCQLAGGKNIAADLTGSSPTVDPEWVLKQNPDIIIKVTSSSVAGYEVEDPSKIKALSEAIADRPGWSNTTAVKSKRVYVMSRDICYGTDYIIGLIYLAKWFHPDLFKDLDSEKIHQEYLDRFPHLDYDLGKHGVFIYPPADMRSTATL